MTVNAHVEVNTTADSFLELEEGDVPGALGRPYRKDDIEWFRKMFIRMYPKDGPMPDFHPHRDGKIVVFFPGDGEPELTINIENRTGRFEAPLVDTRGKKPKLSPDRQISRKVDLQFDPDWNWLVQRVKEHAEIT